MAIFVDLGERFRLLPLDLDPSEFEFISSKPAICAIDTDGWVEAVSLGLAEVRVRRRSDFSERSVVVRVKEEPFGIEIDGTPYTGGMGNPAPVGLADPVVQLVSGPVFESDGNWHYHVAVHDYPFSEGDLVMLVDASTNAELLGFRLVSASDVDSRRHVFDLVFAPGAPAREVAAIVRRLGQDSPEGPPLLLAAAPNVSSVSGMAMQPGRVLVTWTYPIPGARFDIEAVDTSGKVWASESNIASEARMVTLDMLAGQAPTGNYRARVRLHGASVWAGSDVFGYLDPSSAPQPVSFSFDNSVLGRMRLAWNYLDFGSPIADGGVMRSPTHAYLEVVETGAYFVQPIAARGEMDLALPSGTYTFRLHASSAVHGASGQVVYYAKGPKQAELSAAVIPAYVGAHLVATPMGGGKLTVSWGELDVDREVAGYKPTHVKVYGSSGAYERHPIMPSGVATFSLPVGNYSFGIRTEAHVKSGSGFPKVYEGGEQASTTVRVV